MCPSFVFGPLIYRTGVALPFLSYGGSVLLASLAMIGILMNLHANRKEY